MQNDEGLLSVSQKDECVPLLNGIYSMALQILILWRNPECAYCMLGGREWLRGYFCIPGSSTHVFSYISMEYGWVTDEQCVDFSSLIVAGTIDNIVRVFDQRTKKCVHALKVISLCT